MVFENSEWIWLSDSPNEINEYGEFLCEFDLPASAEIILRICAKSDYAAFINGELAGFNQYSDFPDEKIYDEYYLQANKGKNVLAVSALSKNYSTASHIANGKGIIFEVIAGGKTVLVSDKRVPSRLSKTYASGNLPYITPQLGMSFKYDFRAQDGWKTGDATGFSKSVVCDVKRKFAPRPVKKLDASNSVPFLSSGNGLYDAKREYAGYLCFDIESDSEKELTVSYGEHVIDGGVRRTIHERDFSVKFVLKKGRNVFREYFLRFGLRYLQLSRTDITVNFLGVNEAVYPHEYKKYNGDAVSREIYDAAVRTLDCCIHEHYEDCPWREQAQYAMDSRTQILCGYRAFGETQMPAAALRAMAHRLTSKNALPITSPSESELSIPSFSLVYPLMLKEYYAETGDKTLLADVFENTRAMLEHYIASVRNGLIPTLAEWNFFEWEEGLHNETEIFEQREQRDKYSLPVNAFAVKALSCFADVCDVLGYDSGVGGRYRALAENLRECARTVFCGNDGLFRTYCENGELRHLSEYTQVLALYSEIAKKEERKKLLDLITNENDLVPLTVSNYIFKYEVLFEEGGYEEYVKKDVAEKWGYMLEHGATTFWETIKGARDFGGAGSLCHGWSAVPVFVAWELEKGGTKKNAKNQTVSVSGACGGGAAVGRVVADRA